MMPQRLFFAMDEFQQFRAAQAEHRRAYRPGTNATQGQWDHWKKVDRLLVEADKARWNSFDARLHNGQVRLFGWAPAIEQWRWVHPDTAIRWTPEVGKWVGGKYDLECLHIHLLDGLPADLAARAFAPAELVKLLMELEGKGAGELVSASGQMISHPPDPAAVAAYPAALEKLEAWLNEALAVGHLVEEGGLIRQPLPAQHPPAAAGESASEKAAVQGAKEADTLAGGPTKKRQSRWDSGDQKLLEEMRPLVEGGMSEWQAASKVEPRAGGSNHGDATKRRLITKFKLRYPELSRTPNNAV